MISTFKRCDNDARKMDAGLTVTGHHGRHFFPSPPPRRGILENCNNSNKKKNTIGVGPEHFTLIKGEAYFAYLAR